MGFEIILKIAGIGIITAVVNQMLKHFGREEITTFTTLAAVIIVFIMVIGMVTDLFNQVKNVFGLF